MKNIIIGGTSGLGRALANILRDDHQTTFVVGRSHNKAQHGDGMTVDLTSESDARKLATFIDQFDGSDLNLYWVAGYGYSGDFAAQKAPAQMAAVNFGNVLPAIQAGWRIMLRRPNPCHLVIISSTSGFKARAEEAVYAGTKHAQAGFARSLGLESERLHSPVRVALFLPGGMRTPFWDGHRPANFDEYLDPDKVAQRILDQVTAQTQPFYEEVIERGSL